MLIDFKTGKVIPDEPVITITQSLVKSYDIIDKTGIDFEDQSNNDWNEILPKNGILNPKVIIDQFQGVLAAILKGEQIDSDYCQYMFEQCKDWEVSDQCTIAE